jgi:ubiquinone/menaquinone biosynthesis C-methylase UbiE
MNPYIYTKIATARGESLLSLCAGIGFELHDLNTSRITAVDISPQYCEVLRSKFSHIKVVNQDSVDYIKDCASNEFQVVTCIDGLEHISKERGQELLDNMKRVCSVKCLIFTPDRYLRNEPHNAWGIEGSDVYQHHLSAWTPEELILNGFKLINQEDSISQHGEPFKECMYEYIKVQDV